MMRSWQLIFLQSKVNNGVYDGDRLPGAKLALAQRNVVSNASTLSPKQRKRRHGNHRTPV